jgi:hypothetical protein
MIAFTKIVILLTLVFNIYSQESKNDDDVDVDIEYFTMPIFQTTTQIHSPLDFNNTTTTVPATNNFLIEPQYNESFITQIPMSTDKINSTLPNIYPQFNHSNIISLITLNTTSTMINLNIEISVSTITIANVTNFQNFNNSNTNKAVEPKIQPRILFNY